MARANLEQQQGGEIGYDLWQRQGGFHPLAWADPGEECMASGEGVRLNLLPQLALRVYLNAEGNVPEYKDPSLQCSLFLQ